MELIDVVDDHNKVISSVSEKELYQKNLAHRIVHVLVFNNQGEIALQLRSKTKSFCPGCWSTSVGGRVQSGESYVEAAIREMKEEIGIELKLEKIADDLYIDPNHNGLKMFQRIYKTKYNQPISNNDPDIERFEYKSLGEIQRMVDNGEKFHPEFLVILSKYFGINTK